MKYLKKFLVNGQYEDFMKYYRDGKHMVSWCALSKTIYMDNFIIPKVYESVDLGLPSGTKWAKCNVGADTETEYGLYYKFASGIYDGYNNEFYGESGTDGTTMSPSLDSAKCIMGGDWHTPTKTQCEELLSNTTQQWTSINGVNGCKFTSGNGNYIFIPASGHIFSGSLSADGTEARVWTSTIKYSSDSAYVLSLENGSYSVTSNWQYISYTVRGVKDN
jgi:hypothetical protein